MKSEQAQVIAEDRFADWANNLPEGLKEAAVRSLSSVGNYVDNEFNRSVLNSIQLELLRRVGLDLNKSPTSKGIRGVLQFSRRISTESLTRKDENLLLDDSALFIEGRDPNKNLIFVALINTNSGEVAVNCRTEVLRLSCAPS